MKKLLLFSLILLLCISCSSSKYRVCESCYTEENALKVLDAYLNIDTIYGKKNEIYDLPNIYYIEYLLTVPEGYYSLRDGAAYVIIRKRDCKILYHGR